MGEFNSDDHYIYYCGQVEPKSPKLQADSLLTELSGKPSNSLPLNQTIHILFLMECFHMQMFCDHPLLSVNPFQALEYKGETQLNLSRAEWRTALIINVIFLTTSAVKLCCWLFFFSFTCPLSRLLTDLPGPI